MYVQYREMDTQQQRAFNLRASTFCSSLRIGWSRSVKRRGPLHAHEDHVPEGEVGGRPITYPHQPYYFNELEFESRKCALYK